MIYVEFLLYQPFQRKYWDWKEKLPKHPSASWFECIEKTEPALCLINADNINCIWSFDEDHTVFEMKNSNALLAKENIEIVKTILYPWIQQVGR